MKPHEAICSGESALDILIRAADGDPAAERAAVPLICQALRSWRADNGTMPLERYLRISGLKALDRRERDSHLIAAYALMPLHLSPWMRSVELADSLDTFRARVWPTWKSMSTPPANSSQVYRHLDAAMRAAVRMRSEASPAMPDTARRLHEIVKNSRDEIS